MCFFNIFYIYAKKREPNSFLHKKFVFLKSIGQTFGTAKFENITSTGLCSCLFLYVTFNVPDMNVAQLLFAAADLKLLLSIGYILFVMVTIAVIIHDKRDPVKALSWIIVISLLPVVGFILYIVFGRNHRKQKIFNRKELHDLEQIDALSRQQIYEINNAAILHKPEISDNRDIITLLLNSNKALLTMHNEVTVLNDGKETFDEIRRSLHNARSSIHMEYYIIEDDPLGREIADILIDKAHAGVEVRVIYDDVGSWGLGRKFIKNLRRAGVQVQCFMPVVFPWLTSHVNYRNHRKILVVDGKIGFTGGINIAQRYLTGTRLGPWRDTHLKLEGEAVGILQIIFMTDWFFVSKEKLIDYPKYLPKTQVKTETPIQIVTSGPDSDWASIMQAFFSAITHAQHHIYISSPYFLPNEAILTAIKVASLSGIDVRIMIPSRSDSKIVYWASRSYIEELIDANVKVYLYRQGFNHSKLIMIDGKFSSVGTANMDIRSFEDNFEVSAILYDKAITEELEERFLYDLQRSRLVTREYWESRPNLHNFYEALSRLFSPLL